MTTVAILVLGTADWNQQIATNQHYVVREIAKEYPLTYVESMGLRTPELKWRDIKRIFKRVFGRGGSPDRARRPVPSGVRVLSPRVIPKHTGIARLINKPLVERLAKDWISSDGPRILWAYTPVTYGLERYADQIVYHCVDLLATVEGISASLIDDAESRLAGREVTSLGTSDEVVKHLREVGFSTVIDWPNVADTEAVGERAEFAPSTRKLGAVFAGNLTTQKVDFDLLGALVKSGVDLHLAGPIAEGGGSAAAEVRELERLGATYHGMLSLGDLADLYWNASVGLIPYVLNPYTRGVNPLKTYEYLAAGMAVVSSAIPSASPVDGHVFVAEDVDEFVARVQGLVEPPNEAAVAARSRLADAHSWTERGAAARHLIETCLAMSGARA